METSRFTVETRQLTTVPLPFRLRDANNNTGPHNRGSSTSSDRDQSDLDRLASDAKICAVGSSRTNDRGTGLPDSCVIGQHQLNKENVSLWLDQSTSPVSVITQHEAATEHVPSPSPICSPCQSCEFNTRSDQGNSNFNSGTIHDRSANGVNEGFLPADLHLKTLSSSRPHGFESGILTGPSTSKNHGVHHNNQKKGTAQFEAASPSSPSESSHSFGSESSFLSLLASKLLWYKEHRKPGSSRHARDVDEKHVMEHRSQKPSIDEITLGVPPSATNIPRDEAVHHSLVRSASEAASEFSLGSAQDRSLSTEFNAMLAAAAAGVTQANNNPRQNQLSDIREDSFVRNDLSPDYQSDIVSSLTVMRQGRENEEMDLSNLPELPLLSSRSSTQGSPRIEDLEASMQLVPMTLQSSDISNPDHVGSGTNAVSSELHSTPGENSRNSFALALVDEDAARVRNLSPMTSTQPSAEAELHHITSTESLEKIRKDKVLAQALAYQDAKNCQHNNWYRREETKINAWENQQKINTTISMKKVEMKLEAKRAKAFEQMHNEIARAHKTAQERKASVEAVRAARTLKTAVEADSIRKTGKLPTHLGCFPF